MQSGKWCGTVKGERDFAVVWQMLRQALAGTKTFA
jgi:hypothetical protein